MGEKSDVLQGTLDLMVLKTLESMGPLHGYGIARRIEQVSGNALTLNQGTIYPALLRLEQRGWIKSEWGVSESNRRAKFYSLSRIGRKKIEEETENWSASPQPWPASSSRPTRSLPCLQVQWTLCAPRLAAAPRSSAAIVWTRTLMKKCAHTSMWPPMRICGAVCPAQPRALRR